MSKYTKCFKTLESLLDIRMDKCPGQDAFLKMFAELSKFEIPEETFDPRRCIGILDELKKYMRAIDYKRAEIEFKTS